VTVYQALALLEFGSVSTGLFTVDAMLKRSPVAVLRCGSVHPGRYLALVGGSVASTEEAHGAGLEAGLRQGSLLDDVLLADPGIVLVGVGRGELRLDDMQVVLDRPEPVIDVVVAAGAGGADQGVGLVDDAVGLDPRVGFRDPREVPQVGLALVATTGINRHRRPPPRSVADIRSDSVAISK